MRTSKALPSMMRPWAQALSCSMPRNTLINRRQLSTLVRSSIPRLITWLGWTWFYTGSRWKINFSTMPIHWMKTGQLKIRPTLMGFSWTLHTQPSGQQVLAFWMTLVSLRLGNWHLSPRLILPSSCMGIITSSRIMGSWLSFFPTVFFSVEMRKELFVRPC